MNKASNGMTDWEEVSEPKVWRSFFRRSLDFVDMSWHYDGDRVQLIHALERHGQRIDADSAPTSLYFADGSKIPNKVRDAFIVVGTLLIVSESLRATIAEFASDCTQFFEVPIHADEAGTPTDLPNHFIFNVFAAKDALIPALSENIVKPVFLELGLLALTDIMEMTTTACEKSLDTYF